MNIHISTIEHKEQRYPTVGDWIHEDGKTLIKVSKVGNSDYEFLVSIHELIEMYLCKKHGVSQEVVDEFDKKFEEDRDAFGFSGEPGDSIQAPYHDEHKFATKIERLLAKHLKVNWKDYEKTIDSLSQDDAGSTQT